MIRKIFLPVVLLAIVAVAPVFAQFGGTAGAFMTLGYGARGIGLGNAMVAYTGPEALVLYNPAASAFAETREVYGSYSALGLDRAFNVLSFTAPIPVYRKKNSDSMRTQASTIGISVGAVFSGENNIDARDADGEQIGIVTTHENFYYGSFAIRFRPNFSVGVLVRFFDAKLWDQITSSGLAIDVGAIYKLNDQFQFGAVVQNLAGGGYRWDTSPLYNANGQVTTDKFPTLFRVGVAYHPADLPAFGGGITQDEIYPGSLYLEFEQSSVATSIIRGGAEYALGSALVLRAGIDGFDLQNRLSSQVRPSFGITARPSFNGFTPSFHYAAVIEPIAGGLSHVLSLGFQF